MAIPTEEVVGRPMVARACGCLQEFQQFAVDKYRAQRLAKFQKTRCAACVEKLNQEQQRLSAMLPKKGEAMQLLPAGTQVALTKKPDGTWSGTLTAAGTTVETIGDGSQGVTVALARLWVVESGTDPTATKPPVPKPPAARPAASAGTRRTIPPPTRRPG